MEKILRRRKTFNFKLANSLVLVAFLLLNTFSIKSVKAADSRSASLYIGPSGGTYHVGETFSVSLYVNSGENFINAVEADLSFPPDKLQVESPSTGKSFIDVWVGQPQFSNSRGTLNFRGTIPTPGIKISQGLISTVTFRVKSTGRAIIKYTEESKVLLNDGRGTDILSSKDGAIFDLTLPPPAGPIVTSRTHPDQAKWYSEKNAVLLWTNETPATAYSYIVNDEPISVPDEIPEGPQQTVRLANLEDGNHYFHIKAYRDGVWGGTTHYEINIDATPPAEFVPEIEPGRITTSKRPIISFLTTDAMSGISHYELKLIPLKLIIDRDSKHIEQTQSFFIDAQSPYLPELSLGKYDVLIRAYDNAGNFSEGKSRLSIVTPIAGVGEWAAYYWSWLLILLIILAIISYYIARHYKLWHYLTAARLSAGALSRGDLADKLKQLQAYQKKYGQLMVILGLLSTFILGYGNAQAALGEPDVPTPLVTTYSNKVANDEIFYVGGRENVVGAKVTIFVQNSSTGDQRSFSALTDNKGEWFYTHSDFLPIGKYKIWVQATANDITSAPSATFNMEVYAAAITLGSSKLSFETIYLLACILLSVVIIFFAIISIYHFINGKRKNTLLSKEIAEAEESIRRGFALLRKDIQEEISNIRKLKMTTPLRDEEIKREEHLLADLEAVESNIGKEVWDIKAQF